MKHHTEPVFVDRSGRRRRLVVWAGTAGGALLALAAVVLLAGFTGAGTDAPTLPGGSPTPTVDSRLRTGTGATPGPGAAPPAPTPTVRASTTPTPAATRAPVTSPSRRGRGPDHTPGRPAKGQ